MSSITSTQNPTYRRLLSLLEPTGVKKHGEFLISGRKLVPEFLVGSPVEIKALIVTEGLNCDGADIDSLPRIVLPKALFKELDTHGTHYPILWGVAPALPTADLSAPPKGFELVLALANPLNLGAALRSAEAFNASQVVLLKECAHPFVPKVLRSSSGSALRIKLRRGPSIHDLGGADRNSVVWALDMNGTDIAAFSFPKNFRLLIGEEGLGVPAEFSQKQRLAIRMKAGMDSLNAVAAASIALYAYRAQHPSADFSD